MKNQNNAPGEYRYQLFDRNRKLAEVFADTLSDALPMLLPDAKVNVEFHFAAAVVAASGFIWQTILVLKTNAMKFKHTPGSAAKAVRHLLADTIAKTWDEYFDGEHKANAYQAGLLVCEQVYGARWRETEPNAFEICAPAVMDAMPELFGNYWDNLNKE